MRLASPRLVSGSFLSCTAPTALVLIQHMSSPSSPPGRLSKLDSESEALARQPYTPHSPSRMSLTGHASPPPYSGTLPTPPHTAGFSSQLPSSSVVTTDAAPASAYTSQHTPMSMTLSRDGDRETRLTEHDDVTMGEDDDHRRTDHERETSVAAPSLRIEGFPLLCEKRKALT